MKAPPKTGMLFQAFANVFSTLKQSSPYVNADLFYIKDLSLKQKNVFVLLGVVFLLCSIKTVKILDLFLLQTLLGFF